MQTKVFKSSGEFYTSSGTILTGPWKFGKTFWIFFVIFLLGNIFFSPIFSMIDAVTYAYLGDERSKWGKQRMWGTIGFAVAGFTAGLSMDLYSSGENSINYTFVFVGYAVLNICAAIAVCMYDISCHVSASQVLSNLRSLLANLEVVALLTVVFVCGMLFWSERDLPILASADSGWIPAVTGACHADELPARDSHALPSRPYHESIWHGSMPLSSMCGTSCAIPGIQLPQWPLVGTLYWTTAVHLLRVDVCYSIGLW